METTAQYKRIEVLGVPLDILPEELKQYISDNEVNEIETGKPFVKREWPRLFDLFRKRKITTINADTEFVREYYLGI